MMAFRVVPGVLLPRLGVIGGVAAVFAAMVPASVRAQEVDRSKPPVLGPPPELRLPPVAVRELPNGIRILVVERHKLPVADFVMVLPYANATADPAERVGVAGLTAAMLTEGTKSRTSLEIADQIAYLGVGLSAASGWDATTVALTTPTAQLDSALALFADVIRNPVFPASEFERVRQERLTELLQLKDRGPAIADRVFPAVLFGSASPYGRPPRGTEESVRAMTAADMGAFYRSHYFPNGATIVAVGDVTPAQVEAKLGALFGGWRRGEPLATDVPSPPPARPTVIHLVDKPGAAQSSFRIGAVGVARSTPDFFPIQVLNTALGGSFTSRLNQDLRERRGYTYGASSSFDMRRFAGPFVARAEIVSAKTDSALLAFMEDLRSIRDTVPQAELAKTKRYMELGLPSTFETTADIASRLAVVALYGLPLDYFNHLVANIESVTQGEVQRVARKYIDPGKLTVVIVGDRKSVEGPLAALKVGPVEVTDMSAEVVK